MARKKKEKSSKTLTCHVMIMDLCLLAESTPAGRRVPRF